MLVRTALVGSMVSAAAALAGEVPLRYSLYPLPLGQGTYSPNAINNQGVVVGRRTFGQEFAWRWSERDGYEDLGHSSSGFRSAVDINNTGTVLVIGGNDPFLAVWRSRSDWDRVQMPMPTSLADIREGGITDSGFFCATIAPDVPGVPWGRGVLWTPFGQTVVFDPPPGGTSTAVAVNEHGVVVGYTSEQGSSVRTTTVWKPGEPPIRIGDEMLPYDINDAGVVVGIDLNRPSSTTQAFIWSQAGGLTYLPVTATGTLPTYATGINNSGLIIGTSTASPISNFVYLPEDGTWQLDEIVDNTANGWIFREVFGLVDINDLNWIVGYARNPSGQYQPFILRPPCHSGDVASPYGRMTIDDVLAYLDAFAAGNAEVADIAEPAGDLDIDDVLTFLSLFADGCDP